MKSQIYMHPRERERFLDGHDFYMEQVKVRVLDNFDNIEEEAKRVGDEFYDRIGSASWDDSGDMSDVAESALAEEVDFYMLLSDMKRQTTLGAMASLYHQWDKDFRDFMERKLSHAYDRAWVTENIWESSIDKLFNILEDFGWSVRQAQWFPLLNGCRLVVNVYKHGKGQSLVELHKVYPQYLKGPFDNIAETPCPTIPYHRNLSITEEEFDEIAGALRQFWVDFPNGCFPPQSS